MFLPRDIVLHSEMCHEEHRMLQHGMHFRHRDGLSVLLMSVRRGAPYSDQLMDNGAILIYEGHDVPKSKFVKNPKKIDQPMRTPKGKLTKNGLFYEAAKKAASGEITPELVRVYEKLRDGIWVFNGVFQLLDAWIEKANNRSVFKFKLKLIEQQGSVSRTAEEDIPHNRMIPSAVKREVWHRDKGKCVLCGSRDNLHFDHDLAFSRGGSSLTAANIRLLCARHNLAKSAKIE